MPTHRYIKILILLAMMFLARTAVAEKEPLDTTSLSAQAQLLLDSIDTVFGPGGLDRIDISQDNSAWAIDTYGYVWHWNGFEWTYIDYDAKDIGAGGAYVYLTRSDDSVWIWNGVDFVPFWWAGDPYLEKVDAGADGSLWGVSRYGDVYYWNGLSWYLIGSGARDISIDLDTGVDTVYMTSVDGTSWALNEVNWEWEESNWSRRSIATRTIEK